MLFISPYKISTLGVAVHAYYICYHNSQSMTIIFVITIASLCTPITISLLFNIIISIKISIFLIIVFIITIIIKLTIILSTTMQHHSFSPDTEPEPGWPCPARSWWTTGQGTGRTSSSRTRRLGSSLGSWDTYFNANLIALPFNALCAEAKLKV